MTAPSPAEDSSVLNALNEWRQAMLSNDPDLERHFLKSDVDRSVVFSDLMAQYEQGSSVISLSTDQVEAKAEYLHEVYEGRRDVEDLICKAAEYLVEN